MDSWVADLTTDLLWAEDLPALKSAMRRFASAVGVDYYVYGNTRMGLEQPYIDSAYPPDWMAHYLANGYQYIDPVVLESQRTHLPFAWRFLATRPGGLSPPSANCSPRLPSMASATASPFRSIIPRAASPCCPMPSNRWRN